MATVIKSHAKDQGFSGQAFNFDDMAKSAETYLDQIRGEAKKIIAQAKVDADRIRDEAEREGQKLAHSKVDELCVNKVSEQMQTLLPALQQAAQGIEEAKHAWQTHWERRAVHLACAIASRVIRREVANEPQVRASLIREALELASGSANVRLYLHPDDHAAVESQIQQIAAGVGQLGETEVLADPSVARGSCRVETRFGTIDQSFDAQLERIAEELT